MAQMWPNPKSSVQLIIFTFMLKSSCRGVVVSVLDIDYGAVVLSAHDSSSILVSAIGCC